MNKSEFLAALTAEIRDLSREDIARSLEYYSEMIDEQVEDGVSVEEAIAALGSPEEIGKEILEALPRERKAQEADWGDNMQENIDKAVSKGMEKARQAMKWAEQFMGKTEGVSHVHVDRPGRRFSGDSKKQEQNTYEYIFTEPLQAVDIQLGSSDLRLMRSAGTETMVVSRRDEDCQETVEVQDGTLIIRQSQQGKSSGGSLRLFDFSFGSRSSGGGTVTVYLPEQIWKNIQASSKSGDLEMEDIWCETACFKSTSGDIEGRHIMMAGQLKMEAMSGDIKLRDLKGTDLRLTSMSGDIKMEQVEAENVSAESKSGDITMENVMAEGNLRGESASGDIKLHRSDAWEVDLKSVTGDIQATLLSGKSFTAQSSTGDVRVPESVAGAGECRARSSTGDIKIRLAP